MTEQQQNRIKARLIMELAHSQSFLEQLRARLPADDEYLQRWEDNCTVTMLALRGLEQEGGNDGQS